MIAKITLSVAVAMLVMVISLINVKHLTLFTQCGGGAEAGSKKSSIC